MPLLIWPTRSTEHHIISRPTAFARSCGLGESPIPSWAVSKTSIKSIAQADEDLQAAAKALGYGVVAVHDLAETLRSKGIAFAEECRIFEVCNPTHAAKVLSSTMALSMALPCRISLSTDAGQTRIGMIRPEPMLNALPSDPELQSVASEVESTLTAIIEQAAEPRPHSQNSMDR